MADDENLYEQLAKLGTVQSLWKNLEDLNRRGHAATAMMIASRLENWLEGTLKEYFKNNSRRIKKNLFGFRDPLGSLSAKTDIAFAFGVIEHSTYKTLHVIRDIRNDFAHSRDKIDFYSTEMDKHFSKLDPNENRESAFLQSAVNCINDMKAKLNTRLLVKALGEHKDAPPDKDPTQG